MSVSQLLNNIFSPSKYNLFHIAAYVLSLMATALYFSAYFCLSNLALLTLLATLQYILYIIILRL